VIEESPVNLPDFTAARNRRLRVVIAVVAGGGLALGASGLALAADTTPAPTAAAPEQHTHQPHLDGTVKSIADGHILIVDRDGFTRQINFPGTPEGVQAGVRVHAEGTVNADGVSLDAKTVGVAPNPSTGADGRRGPGPGGPRGPHGPRGEGGKPGAATPPAPSGTDAPPAPSGTDAPPAPSGSDAPLAPPAPPSPSATS
jgi:hypothetical protein